MSSFWKIFSNFISFSPWEKEMKLLNIFQDLRRETMKRNRITGAPETLWQSLLNIKQVEQNSLLDFHAEEIARQVKTGTRLIFLLVIAYRTWIYGWYRSPWVSIWRMDEKQSTTYSFSFLWLFTDISAMIEHFNQIGKLVVYEIVKVKDVEQRTNVLSHWVHIAEKCRDIGNFEGLMQVMSGLSNSAVSRLTQNWNVRRNIELSTL